MERDAVVKLCSDLKLSIRDPQGAYDSLCGINELMDSDWDLRETIDNLRADNKDLETQVAYLQKTSTEQVMKYRELDRIYGSLLQLIVRKP